jgi:hypothetical protein
MGGKHGRESRSSSGPSERGVVHAGSPKSEARHPSQPSPSGHLGQEGRGEIHDVVTKDESTESWDTWDQALRKSEREGEKEWEREREEREKERERERKKGGEREGGREAGSEKERDRDRARERERERESEREREKMARVWEKDSEPRLKMNGRDNVEEDKRKENWREAQEVTTRIRKEGEVERLEHHELHGREQRCEEADHEDRVARVGGRQAQNAPQKMRGQGRHSNKRVEVLGLEHAGEREREGAGERAREVGRERLLGTELHNSNNELQNSNNERGSPWWQYNRREDEDERLEHVGGWGGWGRRKGGDDLKVEDSPNPQPSNPKRIGGWEVNGERREEGGGRGPMTERDVGRAIMTERERERESARERERERASERERERERERMERLSQEAREQYVWQEEETRVAELV